jgi:peptide methionine sulfoxide reductase MsrA
MKFLLKSFLILIIFGSIGYSTFTLLKGPCDSPIEYSLGTFDSKFGISKTDFLAIVSDAEKIWEQALGMDLFTYSSEGSLPINLVYDERQALADRNKGLESKISVTKESADSVKDTFEALKVRYEAEQVEYKKMIESFTTIQDAYNTKVKYFNSQGGARKNEYDALQNERAEIERLKALVEKKRQEVNDLGTQVNALVQKYNSLVKTVNSNISVINQSADKEFEQGEYIMKNGKEEIDIYEFTSRAQLKRVILHELGHALGIDHNDNPDSIMYYLNEGEGLSLSAEDIRDLKMACKVKS